MTPGISVTRFLGSYVVGAAGPFGPDKMKEALQVAADRSAITSVINFA
jgi:hypothetical protein